MIAPVLLLFDIDGTLLRTGGAGREALDDAFAQVFGWPQATRGVPIAGSTDSAIVRGVASRFGHTWEDDAPTAYAVKAAYLAALSARIDVVGPVEACPGVHTLLDSLTAMGPGYTAMGLVTGNWRAGARAKLGSIGLGERFAVGAYGDDAVDRHALVPIACARARAAGLAFERVVVIGDTPADVACARAGGALAVAVETGFAPREELVASGPDLLLEDLATGADAFHALLTAP